MKKFHKPKISIRTQLFIPLSLFLILFPIIIWKIFNATSASYIYSTSENQLIDLMNNVTSLADESFQEYTELNNSSQSYKTKDLYKHFTQKLTTLLSSKRNNAQFFILDENYNTIYPLNQFDNQPESQAIYDYYSDEFNENYSYDKCIIQQINISGTTYLVSFCDIKINSDIAKHLIGYVPIEDISALLNNSKQLILIISAVMITICLILSWIILGSITRPIKKLCTHAAKIGNGEFIKIESKSNIQEIVQLNTSINNMVDELRSSEEAQQLFFQNVSHELRTPLMSIGGYVQGIQCGIFEDNTQAIQVIADESQRMTSLVDGILSLSRMDSKRLNVKYEPISLQQFFKQLKLRTDGLAMQHNIHIILPENDIVINSDIGLLERIFNNIISNCIRYAHSTIIINYNYVSNHSDNCNQIHICISDDGDGLDEECLNHLFDRFYKGNNGNFGIGLSIAKSAAEYMNGSIRAYNNPNGGAEFEVTLNV